MFVFNLLFLDMKEISLCRTEYAKFVRLFIAATRMIFESRTPRYFVMRECFGLQF